MISDTTRIFCQRQDGHHEPWCGSRATSKEERQPAEETQR